MNERDSFLDCTHYPPSHISTALAFNTPSHHGIAAPLSYTLTTHLRNPALGLSERLGAPARIEEQALALGHVLDLDLARLASADLGQHARRRQQLQRVPQADLLAQRRHLVLGRL